MFNTLFLVAEAVYVVGLLVSALLLWLTCKVFRVRYEGTDGRAAAGVGLGRALGLTVLLALLDGLLAAGLMSSATFMDRPLLALALFTSVWLLLPAIVFQFGLPVGVFRAIGIDLVWNASKVVPAGVAVILLQALLFQTFAVPSGNMAETLLGHHKQVACPSCGLAFAVNASAEADPGGPAVRVSGCSCPNCRLKILLGEKAAEAEGVALLRDPGLSGGDRILAGKGLLGARSVRPERFDLVVFDWPGEPPAPAKSEVPIRYVKRLVGLPGEVLAIHCGDLFVLAPDELPAGKAKPGEDAPAPVVTDEQAIELFKQGKFRILRKPPAQVLALLRLVYDSRHPAKDLTAPEQRRWVPGNGWAESGDGFRHDGKGDAIGWLRYRHVLRGADKAQLITDFLGYNTWEPHPAPGENWAGDLTLECEADLGSSGELTLELSRGPDRFQAHFDLGKQTCALIRAEKGKAPQTLKETSVKLPTLGARLRFANVDERLIVWVGDSLVYGDGVEYQGPKILAPDKENDLERPASVGVKGAAVTVKRLRLLRDTYYTTARNRTPSAADVPGFNAADADTWRHLAESPLATYRVEPGHYFLLGDNSPESADSRSWGQVEEKRLLGKVLWRYYPFARWGRVD